MRELIGRIGVDSGQVMVGDPCYLEQWGGTSLSESRSNGQELPEPTGDYSYDGACLATCSEGMVGELGGGLAVVSSSGYGDGYYPVYAERNRDGRIVKLIVDFIPREDDE